MAEVNTNERWWGRDSKNEKCWACGLNPNEPCWGEIMISEDYPGEYTYYCEGHGHMDDREPYRRKPE